MFDLLQKWTVSGDWNYIDKNLKLIRAKINCLLAWVNCLF